MELKGSKTEKNLMAAFAGESQARNKYTYYASVAKKAGYEQIKAFFEETANNEKEHAKIWFKLLNERHAERHRRAERRSRRRTLRMDGNVPTFAKEAREEASNTSPTCLKK